MTIRATIEEWRSKELSCGELKHFGRFTAGHLGQTEGCSHLLVDHSVTRESSPTKLGATIFRLVAKCLALNTPPPLSFDMHTGLMPLHFIFQHLYVLLATLTRSAHTKSKHSHTFRPPAAGTLAGPSDS